MLNINTNNNIESKHSNLKMNSLGKDRKIRPDAFVYKLIEEILPELSWKVLRVAVGLEGRRMAMTESHQLDKCMKIPMETGFEYIHISTVT